MTPYENQVTRFLIPNGFWDVLKFRFAKFHPEAVCRRAFRFHRAYRQTPPVTFIAWRAFCFGSFFYFGGLACHSPLATDFRHLMQLRPLGSQGRAGSDMHRPTCPENANAFEGCAEHRHAEARSDSRRNGLFVCLFSSLTTCHVSLPLGVLAGFIRQSQRDYRHKTKAR